MHSLKITTVGASAGVILNKEVMAHLKVRKGDTLYLTYLAHYGTPDAADLAAVYAFGLARNHGFADGNKRVAWVTARLFLADNGYAIEFEALDAIRVIEDVARGALSEGDLAAWFRQRLKPGRT